MYQIIYYLSGQTLFQMADLADHLEVWPYRVLNVSVVDQLA